jgi:hypothetical protein
MHTQSFVVFDGKMDFSKKVKFCHRVAHTDPPTSLVVAHDSIELVFSIATFNDLDILSADVCHAYLNTLNKECVHTGVWKNPVTL